MSHRTIVRHFGVLAATACLSATVVLAQTGAPPTVKRGATPRTPADSGAVMFGAYCAACHGPSGKGNGPAAAALKVPPADLSQLAAKNGGTFPVNKVEQTLRFGIQNPAHGSSDMPTWGATFRAMGDDATVKLRIANLVRHLETLQTK
jgi:mono/diheme cytochrome c family protein